MPKNSIDITDVKTAQSILRLVERLEELDDVQNVYANFDMSDEVAAQAEA